MKRTLWFALIGLVCFASGCRNNKAAIAPEAQIESQIEELLSRMTIEEKIGQMTQLTLDVLTKGGAYETHFPMELDPALLDTVFGTYKVGSILNTPANTPLTPEAWCALIKVLQDEAISKTGIPIVYGLDQIHGASYTIGSTLFPQEIGMAATFNPSLVRRGAQIAAYETKASSVPWNFSPVLDLGRDARWARQWETYGEDSYLASVMGVACTEGYQGTDPNQIGTEQVAACLKHYLGYGVTISGKDRTPSAISEQELRERHFAPFAAAIQAGALSVMVNSGLNNGMPYHINYKYLTQWLKEGLHWDGVVVTDWADINNLYTRDKVASSKKEAVRLAINAGIDMAMVPYEWDFCNDLRALVAEGAVEMSRIDDAVRRVLRMKLRLNLFEKPYYAASDFPLFGSDQHARVATEAALESITLLKNTDDILPLSPNQRILVAGPTANNMRSLNGGWSLSWQGEKVDLYTEQYHTILEAITAKVGAENVVYEPGVEFLVGGTYDQEQTPNIPRAVAAARGVDVIVLCLGENSYCETPGNLNSMDISEHQAALARALAATGKPVILVLTEGRPRIISSFESAMKAILQTYLPGNYGADALVSILWGDANPSGRLPYTYPKYANSLITYDYKPSEHLDKMQGAYDYDAVLSVQWLFGHGLSYTKFKYSNLRVDKTEFTASDTLHFSVEVKNIGPRAGKETVLLFSSDLYASLTPDVRRLRAFDKIELAADAAQEVKFSIPATDLAFVGSDGDWLLEQGDFRIQVSDQVLTIRCTEGYIF